MNNDLAGSLAAFTTDGDMWVATAANAGKRLAAFTGDLLLHEIGTLEADVSAYDGFPLIDGGATANWKMSFDETDAPDVNDDTTDGWKVGSLWVDVTNDKAWICLDITDGAAVWKDISSALAQIEVIRSGNITANTVSVTWATAFPGAPSVVCSYFTTSTASRHCHAKTSSTTGATIFGNENAEPVDVFAAQAT